MGQDWVHRFGHNVMRHVVAQGIKKNPITISSDRTKTLRLIERRAVLGYYNSQELQLLLRLM